MGKPGRPVKYNLEPHQTQLIALYTDGWTSAQVLARMKEEHGIDIPDRTLKRRMAEWGIGKKMPSHTSDELRPRIQAFWDLNLEDKDMLAILQSEGSRANLSTITRLRHTMGLKRRCPGGDNPKAIPERAVMPPPPPKASALPAADARDSPSDQLLATSSGPVHVVLEDNSSSEDSDADADSDEPELEANPARPWANRTPNSSSRLADQVASLTGGAGVRDPSGSNNTNPKSPTSTTKRPVGRPKGSKNPPKPKTPKKRKRVTSVDADDVQPTDLTPMDQREFKRIKEQNSEMQQLMDALREEADESKAKMLAKARDDAQKYSRIKQLEHELSTLQSTHNRLMDTESGRDERIFQITTTKNGEVERVRSQMAEMRAAFRNASVRVFKYQQNCATFLAGLRRNDPNYSRETTEAELLTEELERCFTPDEMTAIRAQIHTDAQ